VVSGVGCSADSPVPITQGRPKCGGASYTYMQNTSREALSPYQSGRGLVVIVRATRIASEPRIDRGGAESLNQLM
jgi:hypothetical protein